MIANGALSCLSRFGSTIYAFAKCHSALTLFDELSRADPSERSRLDFARAEILAGTLAIVLGKSDKADRHLKHAVNLCEDLLANPKLADDVQGYLAEALNKLASNKLHKADQALATEYMHRALDIHRQMAERNPEDPVRQGYVAWSLANLGSVLQVQEKREKAIAMYEEAIAIWDSLDRKSFREEEIDKAIAGTRVNLASIHQRLAKPDMARKYYREALETLEQLHANSPDNEAIVEDMASCLLNFSNCLAEGGEMEEAVATCSRGQKLLRDALRQEPNRALLKQHLFLVSANRANILGLMQRNKEAAAAWHESAGISPDQAMNLYCRQMRLCCLARSGDLEDLSTEIALISETDLSPEEKFLQAVCWSLMAGAQNQLRESGETGQTPVRQDAESHAWRLLIELRDEGELRDSERQHHLRNEVDWLPVRQVKSPAEWESLFATNPVTPGR